MDAQTSNTIISVAIAVIAVAVVLQAVSAVVSAVAAMKMKKAVEEARRQIEPVAANAMVVLNETRAAVQATNEQLKPVMAIALQITTEMKEITGKVNAVSTIGKTQAESLDEALTETVGRVRVQLGNVEDTMDHVLRNVRETSNHVNQGVLSPIRKVNGIVNGLSAALGFLLQGRTTVQRATHEDEMFI